MVSPDSPPEARPAVLETKFYAPRLRVGQVPRARLVERLARALSAKLTLISAPAGFGKTTLLAEWLARLDNATKVAWLSLDTGDSHPPTFWTNVLAALQRAVPGIAPTTLALLHAGQSPSGPSFIPGLVNELADCPSELVLVLDDYQVIEAAEIHESMAALLDHLPPRLRIAMATRSDPPLPLPRMRVRNELVEVRAADLRFLEDEAAEYLNATMGLRLGEADVRLLEARTEGWIAALQLAALSAQGRDDAGDFIRGFSGDHRYVVDYLVEEVLQRQPAAIRSFLLQTSVLERLNGPLCDAVTGQTGGKATLENLERANLFVVPLDDRRQWYRYHHLFADVLKAHLLDEEPELVPTLHVRASGWYEANAQPDAAIRHAIAGNDFVRAAGLVERESEDAMRRHEPEQLIRWVKALPESIVRSMPVLSTYYAMAIQGMGDLEGSASFLDSAERLLAGSGESAMVVADEEGLAALPSRIPLARGYLTMAAGDAEATMRVATRALELLPPDEHHWRGTGLALLGLSHWTRGELDAAQPFHTEAVASLDRAGDTLLAMISAYNDAELQTARGRLAESRRTLERALEFPARHGVGVSPGSSNLHFALAELCCEFNDLGGAREHLQRAEAFGIATVPASTPYRYCLVRARIRQAEEDFEAAIELLEEAERRYVRSPVPNVRPADAWRARLLLQVGRLPEALEWAHTRGFSFNDELEYRREYEHLTFTRVLLAELAAAPNELNAGDLGGFLQRLERAAEARGRRSAALDATILQAHLRELVGERASALDHLGRALAMAEPEGYVRTFVEHGTPMRDLLLAAVSAGIGGAYSRRLVAAFDTAGSPAPNRSQPGSQGLAEPLTVREVEILRLVAAGMQNQEIADHLVISLATVKRHIANAYGKLGVGNRTAAVARATELHLL